MVGKRGQFYLLAAVVLSTVIIGIATVSNYAKKDSNVQVYSDRELLQYEGAKTLDFGANQGYSDTEMKSLMQNFSESYINYSSVGNSYFVFGTRSSVRVVAYQKNIESAYFYDGAAETKIDKPQSYLFVQDFTPTGTTVRIKIDTFYYYFELNEGQNFYFTLSQGLNGGKYIITG